MNNLLFKKKLLIFGAGGGKPSVPAPPLTTVFPAVLTPPLSHKLGNMSSFSYAEMIDLISDGPIEGLVNKNGIKTYDENIFEGIYLNDAPIKETSSENVELISIFYIKERLKQFWKSAPEEESLKLEKGKTSSIVITAEELSANGFPANGSIVIRSFHPEDSVSNFSKEILQQGLNETAIIEKLFKNKTIQSESLFLTVINIPNIRAFLPKNKFDYTEGGDKKEYPIRLRINNLSDHLYFSIGLDDLTSFGHLEIPRSFLLNDKLVSNKRTVEKSLVKLSYIAQTADLDFYEYDFKNLKIFIWSIYNEETYIKKIPNVLDKYFSYIYVHQNQSSLYNFNTVVNEFKNGSSIQTELSLFKNIEIDNNYNKELVGPYVVKGATYCPYKAFDHGGVVRVTDYSNNLSKTLVNQTDIEKESSDDIRWVCLWPIDSDYSGDGYFIQTPRISYSQYDAFSINRSEQKAVPVTHYVTNEDVECVFLTLNVDQLNDTAHVDLAAKPSDRTAMKTNKWCYTQAPPLGTECVLGSLFDSPDPEGTNIEQTGYYLLLSLERCNSLNLPCSQSNVGFTYNSCSYILGVDCSISNLLNRIDQVTGKSLLYYCAFDCFKSNVTNLNPNCQYGNYECIIESWNVLSDPVAYDAWALDLKRFMLPQYDCVVRESIPFYMESDSPILFKQYSRSGERNTDILFSVLECGLRRKNLDGSLYYPFGLDDKQTFNGYANLGGSTLIWLSEADIFDGSERIRKWTDSLKNKVNPRIELKPTFRFYIGQYKYSTNFLEGIINKYTTAHQINYAINWKAIFKNWIGKSKDGYLEASNLETFFNENELPYVYLYVVRPFINSKDFIENGIKIKKIKEGSFYTISNLLLLPFNGSLLRSNTELWQRGDFDDNNYYLRLEALDDLLKNHLLKSNDSPLQLTEKVKTINFLLSESVKEILMNFQNGRFIGFFDIWSLTLFSINNAENTLFLTNAKNNYSSEKVLLNDNRVSELSTVGIDSYGSSDKINDFILNFSIYVPSLVGGKLRSLTQKTWSFVKSKSVPGQEPTIGAASAALSAALTKQIQNINAGTKLPATIKFEVETGYETDENFNASNPGETFKYCYDIFGLSNETTFIDVGRNKYDFLKARNISTGSASNFINDIYTEYWNEQAYTFELCLKYTGQNGQIFECKQSYFKDDLMGFYFDDFDLFSINLNQKDQNVLGRNFSRFVDENNCLYGVSKDFQSVSEYSTITGAFAYYTGNWRACRMNSNNEVVGYCWNCRSQNDILLDDKLNFRYYQQIMPGRDGLYSRFNYNTGNKAWNYLQTTLQASPSEFLENPYRHDSYLLCQDSNNYLLLKKKKYIYNTYDTFSKKSIVELAQTTCPISDTWISTDTETLNFYKNNANLKPSNSVGNYFDAAQVPLCAHVVIFHHGILSPFIDENGCICKFYGCERYKTLSDFVMLCEGISKINTQKSVQPERKITHFSGFDIPHIPVSGIA